MPIFDDGLHCPDPFEGGGPARIVVDFGGAAGPESNTTVPRACRSKIGTSILARLAPRGRGYAITRYQGYTGVFDYDEESDAFVGQIIDMGSVVEIQGRSVEELKESMRCLVDQRLRRPLRQSATPVSLEEWVAGVFQGSIDENESQFHYSRDLPDLIFRCRREPVPHARARFMSSDSTDGA